MREEEKLKAGQGLWSENAADKRGLMSESTSTIGPQWEKQVQSERNHSFSAILVCLWSFHLQSCNEKLSQMMISFFVKMR